MTHVMRMGTHAEAAYFQLGAQAGWFDELLVNANLLQGTRSATSLLAFQLSHTGEGHGFFVDPITYAFGLNPRYMMAESARSNDLHFKRTFLGLAREYGLIGEADTNITQLGEPWFEDDGRLASFCEAVLRYQQTAVQQALNENRDFLLTDVGEIHPQRLLAPYFHMSLDGRWRATNSRLVQASANLATEAWDRPVWAVICVDSHLLDDAAAMADIAQTYAALPCEGYGLWVTAFNEQRATRQQVVSLIDFLRALPTGRPVIQLYGGFFSALLKPFGVTGLSHGVGYGEQRDVTPVVGGGLPPAKYYLPAIHDEILVIDLVRLVIDLGLTDAAFRERICHCTICKGLLDRGGVDGLLDAYSRSERRQYRAGFRDFPTPDVYRMTRFHFLENRHMELARLADLPADSFGPEVTALELAYGEYARRLYPPPSFLRTWSAALGSRL